MTFAIPSDTELLDGIEEALVDVQVIELHKILFNGSWQWQVGYKMQFENAGGMSFSGTGGGMNVREALWNATQSRVANKKRVTAAAVAEKLEST